MQAPSPILIRIASEFDWYTVYAFSNLRVCIYNKDYIYIWISICLTRRITHTDRV